MLVRVANTPGAGGGRRMATCGAQALIPLAPSGHSRRQQLANNGGGAGGGSSKEQAAVVAGSVVVAVLAGEGCDWGKFLV